MSMTPPRPALLLLFLLGCAGRTADERVEPPRPAPALASRPDAEQVVAASAARRAPQEATQPADPSTEVGEPAGWVAGQPLEFGEILREWHRVDAREVFLVVERLVSSRLAFAEAERLGIRLDPDLVDAESEAQIARFKADVAKESVTRDVDTFVREALGVEPQVYWARIREGVIRQLIAERAVRAWALERENATVRLIVLADEQSAHDLADQLAAGADFAALAREHSVDETAADGGLVPFLVRQEHSPLTRVVFAADTGEVVGPVSAAGHQFLVRVEERRQALSGSWPGLRAAVEDSLRSSPVLESEFLHWKLEMERRYSVDLAPLLERIQAPGSTSEGAGDP